jgi:hypothetical protein
MASNVSFGVANTKRQKVRQSKTTGEYLTGSGKLCCRAKFTVTDT